MRRVRRTAVVIHIYRVMYTTTAIRANRRNGATSFFFFVFVFAPTEQRSFLFHPGRVGFLYRVSGTYLTGRYLAAGKVVR